jgi:hypothetical protein
MDGLRRLPGNHHERFLEVRIQEELFNQTWSTRLNVGDLATIRLGSLIHRVFTAYCQQALQALMGNEWLLEDMLDAHDSGWRQISDFYIRRDSSVTSPDQIMALQRALWNTLLIHSDYGAYVKELATFRSISEPGPAPDLGDVPTNSGKTAFPPAASLGQEASPHPHNKEEIAFSTDRGWEEVEIQFLSPKSIYFHSPTRTGSYNFAERGFCDRRSDKPNRAWFVLQLFARHDGKLTEAPDWPKVEKQVQNLRRILRTQFQIPSDPIELVPGRGYKTRFKVGLAPSFDD